MPLTTRRAFLRACATLPAAWVLAACADQSASSPRTGDVQSSPTGAPEPTAPPTSAPAPTAAPAPTSAPTSAPASAPAPTAAATAVAQVLPATPACGDDDDEPTPAQTEGPYYTPNTPERTSLIEPGMAGTRMVLTGFVLSTGCAPVARALIDFWHCDDAGVYDNVGYTLRGHQFTDDQGRYTLETILPGLYPGRTRHIHVKVQAPDRPVLTTQLYFPDEPDNATDGIFSADLLMDVRDDGAGKAATFSFVLEV